LHWNETENVSWKCPLPGQGWSSPVIFGNQIWMTSAHASVADDASRQRRLQATTNSQPLAVVNDLVMFAVCVDRQSGRRLHTIRLMTESSPEPIHTLNTFASPTPVIESGRLYCHFGANGTAAVDTGTGKVLWTNQELHVQHENGAGSSPVLWRDHLIFHCDGSDLQYIVALDKQTGEVAWRTPRSGPLRDNPQLRKAYGTPLIVRQGDRDVLLSPAADWVYGYDPEDGQELWRVSYEVLGFSIVPRPVRGDGLFYICTCFSQSQLLAFGGIGTDVATAPRIAWRYDRQVPRIGSPILVNGLLYFVSDNGGVLTCLEAKTGQLVWRERLGGNFAASPLAADGRVYFLDRDGRTHVIGAGRQFQLLASNQLDGQFMASPAVADNALFLRSDTALYRIED
jgi:outer membrane protein assembly factor BamB